MREETPKVYQTVFDFVRNCWNDKNPVKFIINGVVVWDDRFYDLEPLEKFNAIEDVNNFLLKNESWKQYIVVNYKIRTVLSHHSIISIKAEPLETM